MKKVSYALLLTAMFLAGCSSSKPKAEKIDIQLAKDKAYEIISNETVSIEKGKDASFQIEFKDSYCFSDRNDSETVSINPVGNVVTFHNLEYSQIVSFFTEQIFTVKLETNKHYTIKSDNPVQVEPGEDATFKVEFEEHYFFSEDNDESLVSFDEETSEVTFHEIDASKTVSFIVEREITEVNFAIHNDISNGTVSCNIQNGIVPFGTVANISVNDGNKRFYAWSLGNYLDADKDPGTVFSFERELTLTLDKDYDLYANYLLPLKADEVQITYHGNGGATLGGVSAVSNIHHTLSVRKKVNTIQGSNVFYREGYTLTSWNTKADLTGTRIGLGSRILPNQSRTMNLYAEWKKQSDTSKFEYQIVGNEVTITKYLADESEVVIPNKIEGKPVTTISDGVFSLLPTTTSIVFPDTIRTIKDGAISNCIMLKSILFFDSLQSISNNAITNCANYRTLYVNAAVAPRQMDWSTGVTTADKIDTIEAIEGKKLITMFDSVAYKSYLGSNIETAFPEYKFYNFSSEASTSQTLEFSILSQLVNEDDIVIYAANFLGKTSDSNNYTNWYTFQANYDLLKYIDFRNHDYHGNCSYMLSQYVTFNNARMATDAQTYETVSKITFDQYGSSISQDVAERSEQWCANLSSIKPSMYQLPYDELFINDFASEIEAKGAKIYRIHQAMNVNALDSSFDEKSEWDAYQSYCEELFDFPVITDVSDHFFPGNCFANDDYHVSMSGSIRQTNLLINALEGLGY